MLYDLFILLTCLIANSVATVSGFGISTILTPTLLWFYPLKETILLVCIVHLFHDMWKLIFFYRSVNIQLTAGFGLAAMCATAISSFILVSYQIPNLSMALGIFLLLYAAILLLNPEIRLKRNWINVSMSGITTGFIAGIFGIVGAIRSMFLLSFDLDKESFVGTSGAISFLINSTRLIVYLLGGIILYRDALFILPFLIAASFVGTVIGRYVVNSIPVNSFQKIVLMFIIGMAIRLIIIS